VTSIKAFTRFTVVASALAACLALRTVQPPSAAAEGSVDPNYVVYGGCGTEAGTAPSHLCHKGDRLGAFFQSLNVDAAYTVCVKFPLRDKTLCAEQQQAAAGVLYVNKITSGIVGKTSITWSVNSVPIGIWNFGLYPDPVVSKFGINPLIVSKAHRLFGLLIKYGGNGPRVRAWRRCDGVCPLRLRLVRDKDGVRHYVVAAQSGGATFELGDTLYVQVDAPGQTDGHGSRMWGRLYTGQFVRDPHGGPNDTAIRHLGPLLCVPPGSDYRAATSCDQVQ
jgi:hypothetical protein